MAAAPASTPDLASAALAAMRGCAANNYAVSVAIVGDEGELRVLVRGDGAAPHTADAAQRKAYTALTFRRPTEALVAMLAKSPDAAGLARLDHTLMVGGGLPIMRGGKAVGGVGVSGATGAGEDEKCAQIAVNALMAKGDGK